MHILPGNRIWIFPTVPRRKRKIKGNKPQQRQFIIRSLQFLLETLSDEWGAVDMSIQLTFASFSGTPTRRLSSYKVVEK
jgi:hypothetical protein